MPLIKYFVVVGSALALAIAGAGWSSPQPGPSSVSNNEERPTIRITSVDHPPERVIIDASLPTIIPIRSESFVPPKMMAEPSQQTFQDAFAGLKVGPQSDTSKGLVDVAKAKHDTKPKPAKKVVAHRTSPTLNVAHAPTYSAQQSAPGNRMSFLETLKERLGQAIYKFN